MRVRGSCAAGLHHVAEARKILTNVGVVDLGEEANLGGVHGVLLGKEELEFKHAAWSQVSQGVKESRN